MGAFNLEDQLTFYGAFHNHKLNQLIHIIFVPVILWSAMVFVILLTPGEGHSFVTIESKDALSSLLPANGVNFSLIVFLGYALYYLSLDFWPGLIYDCFLYWMYLNANSLVATNPNALWIALGWHIVSWVVQVWVGHILLERRRPALTHSLFQSLVLAPIFTFFELLFTLGFRKKLYQRVNRRVEANIRQYKDGVPADKQKF